MLITTQKNVSVSTSTLVAKTLTPLKVITSHPTSHKSNDITAGTNHRTAQNYLFLFDSCQTINECQTAEQIK